MTLTKAKRVIDEMSASNYFYVSDEKHITLDGDFTVSQLTAIIKIYRNELKDTVK